MKHQHVFRARDMAHANEVIALARDNGVPDFDIAVVARSDIELGEVRNEHKEADTDFMPAAVRGALFGAGVGIVVGLLALLVTEAKVGPLGWLLLALGGALVGAWAAALMGSALQDPIRRKFSRDIEDGRILIVIDADEDTQSMLAQRLGERGADHLDHDSLVAMR